MSLRVPLYDVHKRLGAFFGEFAGWEAPINYGSVVEEHMAVRRSVGVFDLSHMGRILVKGADALRLLDHLVPRELVEEPGYMYGPTAFLNERAGFRDDVMLYCLEPGLWLVVCNAANRVKVVEWLEEWASRLKLDVRVEDKTFEWAMLAVQGPESAKLMSKIRAHDVLGLEMLQFRRGVSVAGAQTVLVSRSGWTGEDGFEIILDVGEAGKLLEKIVEAGARPCGLAARDSLRMEMGYVLYGHEIDEDTNPVEARYWQVFRPGPKRECVGCDALLEALRRGAQRVRVGLKLEKKARIVPRPGDPVYVGDTRVGVVTSGAYSPVLGRSIAQAYLDAYHALMGLRVEVERRGKRYQAKVVDFPFVTPVLYR